MEPSDIDDAAMFLLHLRLQRTQVSGLPHELAPKNIEQAYDIQDATHRFGGWPIGLLKVGCTSEIAQQVLGIPHPIGGRIPADGVFESGSSVPQAFLASEPMLECEIAMRIGADGTVEAVAPAIELVNGRYLAGSPVPGPSIIADNSAGCAVVIGTAVELDAIDNLDEIQVTLSDGEIEIAAGGTRALLGGPQASIDWTMSHEAGRGRAVDPGTWIITGTCTGLTPTTWGTTYTADFGSLGSINFSLE